VLSIRKNKGITSLTFSSYSRDADVCLEGVCVLRCTYSRCKRVSKETSRTIEKRTSKKRKKSEISKLHDSRIGNPKLETSNWTGITSEQVQFEGSNFGFPMQESCSFEISDFSAGTGFLHNNNFLVGA